MTDGVELRIEGVDPIVRKFKSLGGKPGHNALRRALRKGANKIRNQARSNAKRIDDPATGEQIAKNIATRNGGIRRERWSRGVVIRVGVVGGAKKYVDDARNRRKGRVGKTYQVGGDKGNPGGDTWYWRFVEFGTSEARAQPFMRPAMNQAAQPAVNAFISAAPKELDKELAKVL